MSSIVVENLSVSVGERELFSHCGFVFNGGDIVLLEGENGTGKTTLLNVMLGKTSAEIKAEGRISINNSENVLNMKTREIQELRSRVARLDQRDAYDSYYGITVREVLEDSLEAYRNARLTSVDRKFVSEVFDEYVPNATGLSLKSKVNKLSGGQKRIVSIIASLCIRKESDIFLIDEPLNNLDINNIVHISNILNKLRLSNPDALMIMVSHCKIFPFINTTARIINGTIEINKTTNVCHACFGKSDEDGFYISKM